MSQPTADRDLIFGILAIQMEFVTREQLRSAMQAWVYDRSKSIGAILCAQNILSENNRKLLDNLVQQHLAKHGNDAAKSLTMLSYDANMLNELQSIADAYAPPSMAP